MSGVRLAQEVAFDSANSLRAYLNFGGVSHVLVDKRDPDTSASLQSQYRKSLPTVFENNHSAILENRSSNFPAYLAHDYIVADSSGIEAALSAANLALSNVAVIEGATTSPFTIPSIGHLKNTEIEFTTGKKPTLGAPFQRISETKPRAKDYHGIYLAGTPTAGWLIVPEAYHPDWTLRPMESRSKFIAQWARSFQQRSPLPPRSVIFKFKPPFWYDLCAWTGAISWASILGFMIVTRLPIIPNSLRSRLYATFDPINLPKIRQTERQSIRNPIVVLPTYEERTSVEAIIDSALAKTPNLQILVVDDNSPDNRQK